MRREYGSCERAAVATIVKSRSKQDFEVHERAVLVEGLMQNLVYCGRVKEKVAGGLNPSHRRSLNNQDFSGALQIIRQAYGPIARPIRIGLAPLVERRLAILRISIDDGDAVSFYRRTASGSQDGC